MKIRAIKFLFVVLTLSAPLFFGLKANAATNLRMSNWFPPQHPLVTEVLKPWTRKIAKVTDGRVRVHIQKKTVGSVANQFDVIRTGQADIGFGNQAYSTGRFHQYKFVEMPGMGDSAEATSTAYWRTYKKFLAPQDELKSIKILSVFTSGPGQMFLRRPEIKDLKSLSGLKVRGGGKSSTHIVDLMGMTSIQAPFSKAAEMISNGVVDGAMFDRSVVVGSGFDRYFKSRVVYEGGLFNVSYFIGMNQKTWNALSKRDQKAIEAISGEVLARALGRVWDEQGRQADKIMESNGLKTFYIAKGDIDFLEKSFTQIRQDWIDEVRPLDGKQIIEYYREQISNYHFD